MPPGLRGAQSPRGPRAVLRMIRETPVRLRIAAIAVLLLYPLGAATLLLVDDGWAVNRLNVRIWFLVTGGGSFITPDDFAFLANIALFVPFFAALAVLIPRWWWVLLAAALSTAVELYQLTLDTRQSDVWDVVANTTGAAVGVGLGILVRHLLRRRAESQVSGDAAAAPPGPAEPTTPAAAPAHPAHAPGGAPDDRG